MSPPTETSRYPATHWTRLFYRDLDAPWRDAGAGEALPAVPERRGDAARAPFGARALVVTGAMLLGAFVSLYLDASGLARNVSDHRPGGVQPANDRCDRPETDATSRRTPLPPSLAIA